LSGSISINNAEKVREELTVIIQSQPLRNVTIDLTSVEYFDSAAAAILTEIRRECRRLGNSLTLVGVPTSVKNLLDLVHSEIGSPSGILHPAADPNLLIQIGDGTLKLVDNILELITFIGAIVEALLKVPRRLGRARWDSLEKLVERSGCDAVPVVIILNFLQGAILAFQAAIQLRQFGANIFVADLVSVSICSEMGPLLTALIVSGRLAAAYAADIGTMQVDDEIDALRVMAIDPIHYLVLPRIVAVAIIMPCLTLLADVAGVLGGCVVAMLSLNLSPIRFFNQVHSMLEISDVVKGLGKSLAFGVEVAMIGCLRGFQVRGGAENVGRGATSAVVTCIFILTITDALFAVFFHYLPAVYGP